MHAIVAVATIEPGRADEGKQNLESNVVPRVKQAPGAIGGYWTRSSDGEHGTAMVVFETEEAARAGADAIPSMKPDFVTFDSIEVLEVVAHF
jgi:hypothetical protein